MKTANHTADTEPVCVAQTADPPVAIPDPLAAVLYGRASTCELDIGNATLTLDDDDPLTPGVHGRVAIWGTPCPGGSCDVTVAWQTRIDPVTFEGFFGLGDVDVDQLTVGGASVPDVVGLDALGDGILPIGQALTSGRGHSDDDDDDDQAIFGHNTRPMAVGVDWTAKRCDLDGQVATLSTDDSTLTVEVDVGGHLANQPPAAAAGDDQTLECEGTSGTEVALDCGDSTDPDDNLVLTQWRYDDRGGELLGNAESSVTTTQALGSRSYHCQVVDAGFQAHEDTVDVVVEDTTDPVVTCGTPAGGTIVPSGVPISFQATAEDVCAGALVPAISNLRCTKLTRSGKTVDKSESCVVSASGDTVTVTNSGGVDTLIGWTASVGDGNGNDASATCGVLVIKKP